MLFWGIITVLIFVLVLADLLALRRLKIQFEQRDAALSKKCVTLMSEEAELQEKILDFESNLAEHLLFYDIIRRIAPIIDREDLFSVFSDEIKYLGQIDGIEICNTAKGKDYLRFELNCGDGIALYLKTKSKSVIRYIPYFVELLNLCLQRIDLYQRLQKLSIHDSLTKVYNRRYFMTRYVEEFERAKKFNLSLSFLMLDIDHFKKINDTYGHLVGDVALREVAMLIQANMREIDFIARFGGEEFVAILPETDKAGAIMVAERISSRISRRRITIFDEAINVSVSIGVASFPQSTIHSDVLIEIADKALYKAKVSGRNRVSWF